MFIVEINSVPVGVTGTYDEYMECLRGVYFDGISRGHEYRTLLGVLNADLVSLTLQVVPHDNKNYYCCRDISYMVCCSQVSSCVRDYPCVGAYFHVLPLPSL